jgi:hypothetical protein
LESIQKQTNEFVGADRKLKFIANHVAVSVSMASNIPRYTNTKFILSNNPSYLCKQIFEYLDELAIISYELMHAKLKPLIDKVGDKSKQQLESYCRQLPILGFDSSFFMILAY